MSRYLSRVAPTSLALLITLAACSKSEPQPKVPLDQVVAAPGARAPAAESAPLTADQRTLLDAGNAAFRAGQYEAALGHYRAVSRAAPDNAAGYYGIAMAARKLGDVALADSATRMMREHSAAWDAMLSDSSLRAIHTKPK